MALKDLTAFNRLKTFGQRAALFCSVSVIISVTFGPVVKDLPSIPCYKKELGSLCLQNQSFQIAYSRYFLPGYWVAPIVIVLWFITARILVGWLLGGIELSKARAGQSRRDLGGPSRVAFWATLFLCVCAVWVRSLRLDHTHFIWLRILFGIASIISIFLLEGLAIAVLEVEDKDVPTRIGNQDTTQAKSIRDDYMLGPEDYLRAREWLLAAWVIILTIVVEFDTYYIPFIGTLEGLLARTAVTVFLATVAVIWVAQTPGKGIGKNRPIGLMNFPVGPSFMHRWILRVGKVLRWSCIDKPSDAVAHFFQGVFLRGHEPALSPGGPRLFAEIIKRYGTGEISVVQEFKIANDGSGERINTEEIYIGADARPMRNEEKLAKGEKPAPDFTRILFSDVPFPAEPTVSNRRAIMVPALGESIDEDRSSRWTDHKAIEIIDPGRIYFDRDWLDNDHKCVRLSFFIDRDLNPGEAIVLYLTITAKLSKESFKSPTCYGNDAITRTLVRPCYLGTAFIRLDDSSAHARFRDVVHLVSQEGQDDHAIHVRETARFARDQGTGSPDLKPSTRRGISDDEKSLTVIFNEGLPGMKYKVSWNLADKDDHSTSPAASDKLSHKNIHQVEAAEPIGQITADATEPTP